MSLGGSNYQSDKLACISEKEAILILLYTLMPRIYCDWLFGSLVFLCASFLWIFGHCEFLNFIITEHQQHTSMSDQFVLSIQAFWCSTLDPKQFIYCWVTKYSWAVCQRRQCHTQGGAICTVHSSERQQALNTASSHPEQKVYSSCWRQYVPYGQPSWEKWN